MRPYVLLGCLLGACLAACAGRTETGQSVLPDDAGAADSSEDAPIVAEAGLDGSSADAEMEDAQPLDAPPGDFCSGVPKARWGATQVDSPVVTTSMLYLDCCEGAVVRMHTKAALGFDYAVQVIGQWKMEPGDVPVGGDGGYPNVTVSVLGDPSQQVSATGTLHIGESVSTELRLGFCIEAPGDQVPGGSKLYVPEAFVAPYEWNQRFALYLLSDSGISAVEASGMPLDSLALQPQPVVDLMSVGWYEGSRHFVHWDAWSGTAMLLKNIEPISLQGVPFVVVADGQRVYLGSFMTMISSYMVDVPVIMKEEMTEDGFLIEAPMSGPDPRSDPRVIKALQESWKLGP